MSDYSVLKEQSVSHMWSPCLRQLSKCIPVLLYLLYIVDWHGYKSETLHQYQEDVTVCTSPREAGEIQQCQLAQSKIST